MHRSMNVKFIVPICKKVLLVYRSNYLQLWF